MKKTTENRRTTILALAALLVGLSAAAPLPATEPQTITIKDWTGRGFAPDLVSYTIAAPKDGGKSLRVLDADGKPVPVQVTPGEKGKATLSFVASVAPTGTASYAVGNDGQGAPAQPAVSAGKEGDALALANQQLAVKVPAVHEKSFDKPVAADTLPAPILAFRGLGGAWKGEGRLLLKRPVKKFAVTQTANGPVYVETRYRLDYAEGGWYEATIRVTDRAPHAQVTEAYDLGAAKNAEFWQLDLSKGWNADEAEHMSVAGQGFYPVQYPTLDKEEKTVASGPGVGSDFPGGGENAPVRAIHHDSCWGGKYVSYYGIQNAEERKASPDGYALAMVAPLHKGAWRRPNSVPVFVKSGQVRVLFPMDVAPISWQNEPASDVSPFSCHEHDPSLPATYGRRVWGLVLAHPAMIVKPEGNVGSQCLGYSVRNLYGTVGLDRYKDFVLEWKDGGVKYPRVFTTPEGVEKYRAAVKADPAFPLATYDDQKNQAPGLKYYYLFTGDPAVAQREIPEVIKQLDNAIRFHAVALSVPHHHALGMWGGPLGHAESVLSWPDLPADHRAAIRSRLALLCYLLAEPDVTSAGDGSHHGNPNMGVARLSDRSNLAALIPDHPMHKAWAEYMGSFLAYKQGTFMAPEGAWFEYGASYHMHAYTKINRGSMGALADKVTAADRIWQYNRQDFDYFLNLLSPFDPRYGSRIIPGMANSPAGQSPHFIQAMGNFADCDPEFAANLRWAWDANGRMMGTGADGITIPAMARPGIPAKAPKLTSRIYPGFGVIFRADQGPDETCLYLRSGYHWSHWGQDQGNMMLYSKGAVLLPPQPYQYGGPKDRSFPDKNFMRFGSPENDMPHDWSDSNILDARFGDSVDYAWHSTGYPDWYFTPGAKPGWGSPRLRAEAAGTTDGAFTWDRQVVFLKSPNPKGANYFVIRGSANGVGRAASWFFLDLLGRKSNVRIEGAKVSLDTEWPTKLDMIFTDREKPAFELAENDLPLAYGAYTRLIRDLAAGEIVSRDWVGADGNPIRWSKAWSGKKEDDPTKWEAIAKSGHNPGYPVSADKTFYYMDGKKEQHVALRLQSAPGQEVAWVLFPRGAGEAAPTAAQLAPGVTKVVTGEGTDYVFLSATPLEFKGEGIEFAGTVGALCVPKTGEPELVLLRGSKLRFKGKTVNGPAAAEPQVTAEGGKVRFVAPAPVYVKLNHGNVGVRGVGPFDLTFTPEGITGTVDGGVRTIVTTWPEKIVRPGYWMDGVRWCAGFADEHSVYKGTAAPQLAVAFGVSAGKHEVKIAEWEWAAMPPAPPRAALNLK
ncbi:MAG: hypothetical protein FJ291_27475 [Planctomycetes bacterium]|nr:hypothetical protein [Planctomycetota bacterium]